MNAPSLTPTIKTCACGRSFTRAEWLALPFIGVQRDDIDLEMRNCPCGSSIVVEQASLIGVGSVIRYQARTYGGPVFVGEVREVEMSAWGTVYHVTNESGRAHTVVARWSRLEVLA